MGEAASRRGEGQKGKRCWSSESASEGVPGHIYALFSLQRCLPLVGPTADRKEATSQKHFAFLTFVLVGLVNEQRTTKWRTKGRSANGGTVADILGTLNNLSAQTLKRLLAVTVVYKPP